MGSCSATWVARCLIESADAGSAAMGTMLLLHSVLLGDVHSWACVIVRPMPAPPVVTTHLSLGIEKSLEARSRLLGVLRTGAFWSCRGESCGVFTE